jgi:hypothetical protein
LISSEELIRMAIKVKCAENGTAYFKKAERKSKGDEGKQDALF